MNCINMQNNQMDVLTLMFVWFDAINNETRCDEKCWVERASVLPRSHDHRTHTITNGNIIVVARV